MNLQYKYVFKIFAKIVVISKRMFIDPIIDMFVFPFSRHARNGVRRVPWHGEKNKRVKPVANKMRGQQACRASLRQRTEKGYVSIP